MSSLNVSLSSTFEHRLLKTLKGEWATPKHIRELSDFYISDPGRETPWSEPHTLSAYLSYFLPLNVARLRSVWREVNRFLADSEITEIWDFGSGLGATQWVMEDEAWLSPKPLYCLEISPKAIRAHEDLAVAAPVRFKPQFVKRASPQRGALAVFSYSFLEIQHQLPSLDGFSHILIVEPSTRECGRQLMEWRQKAIAGGLYPLAPCTHSEACPLLTHSGRDWCHMRVGFHSPDWFQKIEEHLPMKNRTLTYSYLLLSREHKASNWSGSTRVIGDTLEERGKTRQMICRGSEREFLSWLTRDGEAPRIPHGALIKDLGTVDLKGSEVRASRDLKWSE